jgi:hypothetical protein
MNKQYESANYATNLEEKAASAIDYINEDIDFFDNINSARRWAIQDLMKYASSQLRKPSCLKWSIEDIQAQGEFQNFKIDDAQAHDLLEGFLEYIIEVANNAMAEYVYENYDEQQNEQ